MVCFEFSVGNVYNCDTNTGFVGYTSYMSWLRSFLVYDTNGCDINVFVTLEHIWNVANFFNTDWK